MNPSSVSCCPRQFTTEYGNVSTARIGAIRRGVLQIDEQSGDRFFGEPMLNVADFMQTVEVDGKARGVVNILAADQLMNSSRLSATFLLWMLSEIFEQMPEVGDLEQPKLVFFFDEAHLLFDEAPKALVAGSLVAGVYEKAIDRESAYEKLEGRAAASLGTAATTPAAPPAPMGPVGPSRTAPTPASGNAGGGLFDGLKDVLFGSTGPRGSRHEGLAEAAARSAVRTLGSSVGREIIRGVLGGIPGGGRRR